MAITLEPIGVVHTDSENVARHWTVFDVKGTLVIDKQYQKGTSSYKRTLFVDTGAHKNLFPPDL